MARSLNRPDQVEHQAVSQADAGEGVDSGVQLARQLHNRYVASPGVIPTAATLGLARRISRLSTGRLPLLDSVQRRWASIPDLFRQGASVLNYARPPALSGLPSPSPPVAQSAATGSPGAQGTSLRRAVTARPVSALQETSLRRSAVSGGGQVPDARTGRQAVTKGRDLGSGVPPQTQGGAARDAIQRQVAAPRAARARARPVTRTSRSESTILRLHAGSPAVRAVQRQMTMPGVVRAKTRPVTGTGRSETTILRLHAGSPAARAVQRRMAMPGVVRPRTRPVTRTSISRSETTILRLHAGSPTGRAVQRQGAMSRAILTRTQPVARASTSRSETTLLQLQQGAPAERTVERQVGSPVPGMPSTKPAPLSAPAEGPGRAGGGERALPGLQAAPETAIGVGSLGTAILHRYRAGPVEQANQDQGASPGPARPASRVSRQSLAPGKPALIMAHRLAPGERSAEQKMPATTAGLGRPVETPAPSGSVTGTGMALLSGVVHRASETNIVRQLGTPPSRPALPIGGVFGGVPDSNREPGAFSQDMPLLQRVTEVTVGAGVEGTGQVSGRRPISGTPPDLAVQRAATDLPLGRQSEPPGPDPLPPAEGPVAPGPEGPDLEHLADEVMAIIEQRLTIQRESMGL